MTHAPAPGWTVRGKSFLLPFVVILVLLLAATLAISLQFQAIMRSLDQTRSTWPAASAELAARYEQFDKSLSAPEQKDDTWSRAWKEFRETTQYDRQVTQAIALEDEMGRMGGRSKLPTSPAFASFLQSEQNRLAAQKHWIGRLTITALQLKLPPTFSEKL